MLFEEEARRLLNIEELEYDLPSDSEKYVASCTSRFNNPEHIAVLGDVMRRLALLKGTRAAVGRTTKISEHWPKLLQRISWLL